MNTETLKATDYDRPRSNKELAQWQGVHESYVCAQRRAGLPLAASIRQLLEWRATHPNFKRSQGRKLPLIRPLQMNLPGV